ncbi:hypothetical protein F4811DRAFT_515813 [Daldinia bambusicola]|nr:hypothetical protein F4811DRAFT_515813 [Daldinia bambusicola]
MINRTVMCDAQHSNILLSLSLVVAHLYLSPGLADAVSRPAGSVCLSQGKQGDDACPLALPPLPSRNQHDHLRQAARGKKNKVGDDDPWGGCVWEREGRGGT